MEIERRRVVKNGYGVFNLAWQAEHHPEWPRRSREKLTRFASGVREAHDVPVKFRDLGRHGRLGRRQGDVPGGRSAAARAALYLLDSTDPEKLNSIVEDMQKRSGLPPREFWKRTLVVGMAMGMTSYEPVVNLERIAAAYDAAGVDSRANIYYMTLPGSLLDQFASARGYRARARCSSMMRIRRPAGTARR